jgi:hypothetical protein
MPDFDTQQLLTYLDVDNPEQITKEAILSAVNAELPLKFFGENPLTTLQQIEKKALAFLYAAENAQNLGLKGFENDVIRIRGTEIDVYGPNLQQAICETYSGAPNEFKTKYGQNYADQVKGLCERLPGYIQLVRDKVKTMD